MAGKPGAQVCELCHGKGHSKSQCTSKGGGKWADPGLNQKGKGAGSYGQQGKAGGNSEAWVLEKAKANSTALMRYLHLQALHLPALSSSGNHSGNHSGSLKQQLSFNSHGCLPQRLSHHLETHGHSGADSSGPAQVASTAWRPALANVFIFCEEDAHLSNPGAHPDTQHVQRSR